MRLLWIDLKRAFMPGKFIGIMIGIILLNCLDIFSILMEELQAGVKSYDLCQLFVMKNAGISGIMQILIMVLCMLPYGMSFAEDYGNHCLVDYSVRTSMVKYAFSKLAVCFTAAFTVSLLSEFLWGMLMLPGRPLANIERGIGQDAYTFSLVAEGSYRLLFGYLITLTALKNAFYASLALIISAWIPSKYFAIAMPVVGYQFLMMFTFYSIDFPGFLDPVVIFAYAGRYGIEGDLYKLLYAAFYAVTVLALFGILFARKVRRRVND